MEKYEGVEKRHLPRTFASEIAYQQFGANTFPRSTEGTISAAMAVLVPNNPNRVSIILINNSASVIYFDFVPEVSATRGLILAANGGVFRMNIKDEGEAVSSEIWGLGVAADQEYTYIETILQRT